MNIWFYSLEQDLWFCCCLYLAFSYLLEHQFCCHAWLLWHLYWQTHLIVMVMYCRLWLMVIHGLLLLKMPLGGCLMHSSFQTIKMLLFWEDVLGKQIIATFRLSYMTLQDQGGCMTFYFDCLSRCMLSCVWLC